MSSGLALFQPARLQEVAAQVVVLHPHTAAAPAAIDESSLQDLRRRVAAVAGNLPGLESLALALSPREVRGVISGLILWEDLRSDALVLLRLRLRASHLPQLWKAWQRLPTLRELVDLIGQLPPPSWQFLGPPYGDLAPLWVQATEPGVELQQWLDGQQMTHSDLPRLGGAAFMENTPLIRLAHEAVLTHGSSAQLRREEIRTLIRLAQEMPVNGKRMLFGRNYLSRFLPAEWRMSVLEAIRDWYGLPRRPKLSRFWGPVPEEIRAAFQRLFIERTLERAFGDDERSHYWLRWRDALDDAHEGTAGGTGYVVLLFGAFGVVEFFEIGNAAYFYDRAKAESYAARRAYVPADLKEILFPHIGWFGDNRLIHQQNWQSKADRMVTAYTRHFGRR